MSARRTTLSAAVTALASALLLSGCAPEPAASPAPAPQTVEKPSTPVSPVETTPDQKKPEKPTTPKKAKNPGISQSELDSRLRYAAWANDLDDAAQLISWGANVNAKDSTVQSAYLIATSEGRLELLDLTFKHGADVKELDSWNGTGLIRAAERGHWDVSGRLITEGVDVDHVNRIGYQAIHEAVILGRDDPSYHLTLRVLFAGGANLTTPSVSEGQTPIQMARAKGYPGQIGVLEALAQPAPKNPTAALLKSAQNGDPDAVARALHAGAKPDARNKNGRTARELAERGGHNVSAAILKALGG